MVGEGSTWGTCRSERPGSGRPRSAPPRAAPAVPRPCPQLTPATNRRHADARRGGPAVPRQLVHTHRRSVRARRAAGALPAEVRAAAARGRAGRDAPCGPRAARARERGRRARSGRPRRPLRSAGGPRRLAATAALRRRERSKASTDACPAYGRVWAESTTYLLLGSFFLTACMQAWLLVESLRGAPRARGGPRVAFRGGRQAEHQPVGLFSCVRVRMLVVVVCKAAGLNASPPMLRRKQQGREASRWGECVSSAQRARRAARKPQSPPRPLPRSPLPRQHHGRALAAPRARGRARVRRVLGARGGQPHLLDGGVGRQGARRVCKCVVRACECMCVCVC
jgi:hypothetical protein